MLFDDAGAGSQADAGTFELALAVKPLKYLEYPVVMLHVEADAVVADTDF